jgi:hypothetical protein
MKPRNLFILAAITGSLAACASPQQIDSTSITPVRLQLASYGVSNPDPAMTFAQIYDRAQTDAERELIEKTTKLIPNLRRRATMPTYAEIMAVAAADFERSLITRIASRPHPDTTEMASVQTLN